MDNREIYKIVEAVVNSLPQHEVKMTLSLAKAIALKVEEKAKQIGVNAVVAISDAGSNPILIESMDDAFIASYDIAKNKAFTVVSLKMSTSKLKELAQPGKALYGIQFTNEGKIVIFGGGEPLDINGKIIGGLGVSGGSEDQDTYLAEYGKKVFAELIK